MLLVFAFYVVAGLVIGVAFVGGLSGAALGYLLGAALYILTYSR